MDGAIKALVAAACLCVIAVSGHYGYTTYEAHVSEQQRVERARMEALRTEKEAKMAEKARREQVATERAERRKALIGQRRRGRAQKASGPRQCSRDPQRCRSRLKPLNAKPSQVPIRHRRRRGFLSLVGLAESLGAAGEFPQCHVVDVARRVAHRGTCRKVGRPAGLAVGQRVQL